MRRTAPGVLLAAFVAMALAPALARARGWPRPAAGESQSGDPEVLFTFDDGPHEKWSAQILDTLAAHHVRAIFYWVGHRVDGGRLAPRRRELVARAVREGHLVGNHTVNHVHLCHPSIDGASEIDRNDGLLHRAAQLPIVMFRAPYGDHCRKLVALLDERGLTHLHWDIDPQEWLGLTPEGAAHIVIAHLRALRGRAVVLMHDTRPTTARALPIILDWIEAENLRRQRLGKRPIRILTGSDLVVQRGRNPIWLWGEDAAAGAAGWLERSMAGLVPGAPVEPLPGQVRAPPAGSALVNSPTRTATLPAP